jgi:hypothetical protein
MRSLSLVRISVAAAAVTLVLAASAASSAAAGLPELDWSPTTSADTFDYGLVDVGQTDSQEFTLTNSGGSGSGGLTISLSGSAAFSITSDTCTGTGRGPGKSCSVTVEYAPTTAGQGDAATLTASGKRPATAPAGITLTGSGGGAPELTLSPGDLIDIDPDGLKLYFYDFGSVASATQTFTVTNGGTGSTGEIFLSDNTNPDGFSVTSNCGGVLAPNAACTFDVSFTAPAECTGGSVFDGFLIVGEGLGGPDYIELLVDALCP